MSGRWRELEDSEIAGLCRFMRVFYVSYFVWFLAPLVIVLLHAAFAS